MDFTETSEQQELRRVVAELSAKYGWKYTRAKSATHEPMDELWAEAGTLGFLGVNLPAAYGGGGAGMYELAIVAEELNSGGTGLLMMAPRHAGARCCRPRRPGAAARDPARPPKVRPPPRRRCSSSSRSRRRTASRAPRSRRRRRGRRR